MEELRRHFESSDFQIPSGRFSVELTADGSGYAFVGKGYGHGVGLCQYGAASMGQASAHHRILAHYFPDAGQKKAY